MMHRTDWPTLDGEAFRGLAGDVVDCLAPHTEADHCVLLVDFLAAYGNAVGAGPHVRVGADQHPGRIFAAIVGETSRARKGSGWSMIRHVMHAADPGWCDRIVGGFGSGEAVVDAVRDPTEDGERGAPDERLLVREPELARLLRVAGRENSTLSPIVREAWDGGRLQFRTRQGITIATGAHISVVADITRAELRRELTDTEIANGWANRFTFVLARRSKRLPSGGNLDDRDVAQFGSRIQDALCRARRHGRMRRSAEAEERWREFYLSIDDRVDGMLGSVTARAEAQALRLSVIYALLDGSVSIELQHLDAALGLWQYMCASAELIFGDDRGHPLADRLYQELLRVAPAGLDGTQQSNLFGRNVAARELSEARAVLEREGVAETVVERLGPGRPRLVTFARGNEKDEKNEETRADSFDSFTSYGDRDRDSIGLEDPETGEERVGPDENATGAQRDRDGHWPYGDEEAV
jgi:hypothetical protein